MLCFQIAQLHRRRTIDSPRILIFANGLVPDIDRARRLARSDDLLVCADGGTRHALALGLTPAIVIGDLDSLDASSRSRLVALGTSFVEHPRDKDETDLQLALRYALDRHPSAIVIVGGLGNRLDQTIGNLSLLTDPSLEAVDCRLDDGLEAAFFCRASASIDGNPGDLVSLLPWGVAVQGVRTEGLRWRLAGERLDPSRTRGISNEMLSDGARVSITAGLLLIIHRRRS